MLEFHEALCKGSRKMDNKVNTTKKSRKHKKSRKCVNRKHPLTKRTKKNSSHKNQKATSVPVVRTNDHAANDNHSLTMFNHTSDDNDAETNDCKACELFNLVYSGQMRVLLPSRSWSIHYIEMPVKCIVIGEVIIRFEIETGLIPVHTKQIVFDEKMDYELFFLNAKASMTNKPRMVKTIVDLMCVITFVNNVKLCSGGPEINLYANVNPECAYRDPHGRWRHNLCTLEVTDGDICESCLSLIEILQRSVKRIRIEKHKILPVP